MSSVFGSVDIAAFATFVSGVMVLVIGIALTFKAGALGKRAIGSMGDSSYSPQSWEDYRENGDSHGL